MATDLKNPFILFRNRQVFSKAQLLNIAWPLILLGSADGKLPLAR